MARPAKDRGYAETALKDCPFRLREWRLTPIRPREHFGAVVSGEKNNCVLVFTDVLQLLHHKTDVVVQLRHAGFFFRPSIL